jgi:hypothetical protein
MKRNLLAWTAALLAGCASHGEAGGAAGALAGLEIYDRSEGRRLEVHWQEGRAYIAGKPGNEYRVTLRNRLGEDLLAVVSVDGVNVLSGQAADPSQGGYVLGPRASLDIQGWRKRLSQTAAFYFTSLPDSYAARTGRPGEVGVVGVALFRRKAAPVAQAPAPIASGPSSDRAGEAPARAEQSAKIGTGHGRHEASFVRWTTFERASDSPAEVLTLYYDSRPNLVARGVIREALPVAPLPRPFPGFVPDPPRS